MLVRSLALALVLLVLPVLGACGEGAAPAETGQPEGGGSDGGESSGEGAGDGSDGETGEDPPVDADGDGFTDDVDCDDANFSVNPDAEETWDDVDQDCDGRVDADGAYSGELDLVAVAVREGVTYRFELRCPMSLSRSLGTLDYTATCTPDPSDPDAMDLLGETITFTPRTSSVSGDTWDERSVIESASGWDTFGDTTLTWTSWDDVDLSLSLDTISLDMAGSAALAHGGDAGG